MEEATDPDSSVPLYGISIDSYLQLAMEFDIMKVKD
jgi:hypothetical protein